MQTDQKAVHYEPVSSLLIKTILTAFTFISALSVRDAVVAFISSVAPHHMSRKALFSLMVAMIFLFTTVILAYHYQDRV